MKKHYKILLILDTSFISINISYESVNPPDLTEILSHYFFLASSLSFFAFSSAIFLLVLEINESTNNNPTIRARAGTLKR